LYFCFEYGHERFNILLEKANAMKTTFFHAPEGVSSGNEGVSRTAFLLQILAGKGFYWLIFRDH
jgi:hypothetical protein